MADTTTEKTSGPGLADYIHATAGILALVLGGLMYWYAWALHAFAALMIVSAVSAVIISWRTDSWVTGHYLAMAPVLGVIGGYAGIPRSKFYVLGMVQDANGSYDDLGFDSLKEEEFFSALEFGWTDQEQTGLMYLFNNLHVGLWHSDERGNGATLTGSYTFHEQRLGMFVRLGQASEGASTLYEKHAAVGVTKGAYKESVFGFGVSWGQPQGSDVDQIATEVFYKWQLAQNLALTPSIQILKNPAANPSDDVITVLGLRLRLTL